MDNSLNLKKITTNYQATAMVQAAIFLGHLPEYEEFKATHSSIAIWNWKLYFYNELILINSYQMYHKLLGIKRRFISWNSVPLLDDQLIFFIFSTLNVFKVANF